MHIENLRLSISLRYECVIIQRWVGLLGILSGLGAVYGTFEMIGWVWVRSQIRNENPSCFACKAYQNKNRRDICQLYRREFIYLVPNRLYTMYERPGNRLGFEKMGKACGKFKPKGALCQCCKNFMIKFPECSPIVKKMIL